MCMEYAGTQRAGGGVAERGRAIVNMQGLHQRARGGGAIVNMPGLYQRARGGRAFVNMKGLHHRNNEGC